MKARKCAAAGCRNPITSTRANARYCSEACRKAESRRRASSKPAPAEPAKPAKPAKVPQQSTPPVPGNEVGLVNAVRTELTEAGALATVPGQLALVLAAKLVQIEAAQVVAMSKELRAVIAEAKASSASAGDEPPDPADDDGDLPPELAKARKARDAKARQAADRT